MVSQPPVTGNQSLDTYLRSVYQELTELETKSRPEGGWSLSDLSTSVSEIIGDKRDLIDIVTKWDGVSADISSWNALIESQAKQIAALSGYMANVDEKAKIFAQVFEWWDQNFHIVLTAKEFSETVQNNLASIESAKKAIAASEVNAKTYATNAANSASEAKTSQTAAATSASQASTSATNAANSASEAKTSQTAAATSASQASTSATNAANSASEAKTSQTAAATSASNAKTSETNAADSAGVAETEANRSTTEADRAKTEADKLANSLSTKADVGHKHTSEDISDAVASLTTANAGKVVEVGSDGHIQDDANPTLANHLARKAYVDTKAPATHSHTSSQISDAADTGSSTSAGKVVKWGSSGRIAGLDPTEANHMATKKYVDNATTGIASSGHKHVSADITDSVGLVGESHPSPSKLIRTNSSDGFLHVSLAPTAPSHVTNKDYVDGKVSGAHDGASIVPTDGNIQTWAMHPNMSIGVSTETVVGRYYKSSPQRFNVDGTKCRFSIDPDIDYYVSFYVRADKAGSRLFIEMRDSESGAFVIQRSNVQGTNTGNYLLNNYEVPTEWTRLTGKIHFRPGIQYVRLGSFYFNHQNGTVADAVQCISDIQIIPIAPGITSSEIDSSPYADANESAFKVLTTGNDGFLHSRTNPTSTNHVARKGYVDAEVAKKANIGDFPQTRLLLAGVDLNTITESGTWMQPGTANATNALNYPVGLAGLLEVENYASMTMQRYTVYNTGVTYVRNRYNSTWFGWKELIAATEVESTTQILASKVPRRTSTKQLQVDVNPVAADDLTRKAYVDAQITTVRNVIPKIEVVTELPYTRDANTVYMVVG